mgnify:CR=1 FL=1
MPKPESEPVSDGHVPVTPAEKPEEHLKDYEPRGSAETNQILKWASAIAGAAAIIYFAHKVGVFPTEDPNP